MMKIKIKKQKIGEKVNPEGVQTFHFQEDDCGMYEEGCDPEKRVYFPIIGDSLFLGNVSLLIEREDEDDLLTERIYSINNPLAVIKTDDIKNAWPLIKADDSESLDILQTYPGNLVTLKAEIVPDYLQQILNKKDDIKETGDIEGDVYLTWYLNGNEVTEKFIEENPELEIDVLEDKFQYRVLGKTGGITNVTAKIEKMFSFDEKYALNKNWNISNTENLVNENSISVKIIYPGDDKLDGEEIASLKIFLAPTVHNAPVYLITAVRLAVLLVIIWSILFGFSYMINPRKII